MNQIVRENNKIVNSFMEIFCQNTIFIKSMNYYTIADLFLNKIMKLWTSVFFNGFFFHFPSVATINFIKMARRFCVGGNWKMNGDKNSITLICRNLAAGPLDPNTEVIVGCPAVYIEQARSLLPPEIAVAGQVSE